MATRIDDNGGYTLQSFTRWCLKLSSLLELAEEVDDEFPFKILILIRRSACKIKNKNCYLPLPSLTVENWIVCQAFIGQDVNVKVASTTNNNSELVTHLRLQTSEA